jgi:hypothetical protein
MPDYPYAFLMEAKMQSGDPTSVVLVFTPAGQTIRDAALPDLSDQSRDRFLITNGGLLSEQTATEVYYKQ